MNRFFIFQVFVLSMIVFLSSCKKSCTFENENTNKGWIEKDVVVHAKSSYLTNQMKGKYLITGNSTLANSFQVSFDQGPRQPVNYNAYAILCYPLLTTCSAQFEREVIFNTANQNVVYKITVTECACEEQRISENYVLVPKFPSNFTVTYDISRKRAD